MRVGRRAARAAASDQSLAREAAGATLELRLVRVAIFCLPLWAVATSALMLLSKGLTDADRWTRTIGLGEVSAASLLFLLARDRMMRPVSRWGDRVVEVLIVALALSALHHDLWPALIYCVAVPMLAFGGMARVAGAFVVTAGAAVMSVLDGNTVFNVAVVVSMGAIVGCTLFVLSRFRPLLLELRVAQAALARQEVDDERVRISRELHDIIGRTLVAVSLRTETALRTLDDDPEFSRSQLTLARGSITEAQSNLRRLVRGETLAGLHEEVSSAAALCGRLGIDIATDAVPIDCPAVDALLARVVREATTNLLKHSRPITVRITVEAAHRSAAVVIVNDGAGQASEPAPSGGTGLADLRRRVADVGGVFEAGPHGADGFRVYALVPCTTGPRQGPQPRPVDARHAATRVARPRPAVTGADE